MSGRRYSAILSCTALWLCRIIAGCAFIIGGWAKCVDPAGFVYKIGEYLTAWHILGWIPGDIVLVGAVGLSLFEFVVGVALATGSLRRAAPVCGLLLMAFMLPLTVYIYIADPVSDCGCFGDLLVISNGATMLKNIALTLILVALLVWHDRVKPLYSPGLQWLALVATGIYGFTLAIIGWNFQPVVDFRPYPVGSEPFADIADTPAPKYVYERDGREQVFELDALPDSTWTFVRVDASETGSHEGLAVFDGDEEITEDVLGDLEGDVLLLVVNNPGIDFLTRSRFANELSDAVSLSGGKMIGLVGASGETFDRWVELAGPGFDVYTAGDTQLKELARGNAAVVALRDGKVVWKRSLATLDTSLVGSDEPIDEVRAVDDGRVAGILSAAWLGALLLLVLLDRLNRRKSNGPSINDITPGDV